MADNRSAVIRPTPRKARQSQQLATKRLPWEPFSFIRSVHVASVTSFVGQALQGLLTEHFAQHPVDTAGHALQAAADVQGRALVDPAPQFIRRFMQAVLDIDLLRLVAGEGQVQALQLAPGQGLLQPARQ